MNKNESMVGFGVVGAFSLLTLGLNFFLQYNLFKGLAISNKEKEVCRFRTRKVHRVLSVLGMIMTVLIAIIYIIMLTMPSWIPQLAPPASGTEAQ